MPGKITLKVTGKHKRPRVVKVTLNKKEQGSDIMTALGGDITAALGGKLQRLSIRHSMDLAGEPPTSGTEG